MIAAQRQSQTRRGLRPRFRRAQSAVELAVMVPALALLLAVVGDFARVYYLRIALLDAARAGAVYGAQSRTTGVDYAGMNTAACAALEPNIACTPGVTVTSTSYCQCAGSSGQIICTNPGSCVNVQNFVQVTATATFNALLDFPGMPGSIPLTSVAVMQVQ